MEPVALAESSTEQFVRLFYDHYDKQRILLGNFYRENSAILWNGNAFSGAPQFSEFLGQLPPSQHEISSYDCQPIAATMTPQGTCGILINVTGTVKYGDNPGKRPFSQTFMLMPDQNQATNFFIQSDNFSAQTYYILCVSMCKYSTIDLSPSLDYA